MEIIAYEMKYIKNDIEKADYTVNSLSELCEIL